MINIPLPQKFTLVVRLDSHATLILRLRNGANEIYQHALRNIGGVINIDEETLNWSYTDWTGASWRGNFNVVTELGDQRMGIVVSQDKCFEALNTIRNLPVSAQQ